MTPITTFGPLQKVLSSFMNSLQAAVAPVSALDGRLIGGYLSSAGTTIGVSPVKQLVLGNTYGTKSTSTTLTPGSGGVPSLTTDTWYVVYASVSAGSVAFSVEEYTGNEPDDYLVFKAGDTTKRYVGSFRTYTSSGTKIVPFRQMAGGLVEYVGLETSVELLIATNSSTSNSQTDGIDLSLRLPVHTSTAILYGRAFPAAGGSGNVNYEVYVRNPGFGTGEGRTFKWTSPVAANEYAFHVGVVEGDGTQTLTLETVTAARTLIVDVFCNGYYERDARG